MILYFLACGTHDPLDLPSAPPTPATELATMAVNIVSLSGTISAIQPSTRSFLLSGDGKRSIVIVDQHATVVLNGNAGSVSDLVDSQVATVEGEPNGDLLIASHVVVGTAAPPPVIAAPDATAPAAPAPTDPAAATAPSTPADPASTAPASTDAPDAPVQP